MSANPAQRRYRRRILFASIFYAGSLLLEEYVLRHMDLPVAAKFALAVLPALGIIAMIASLGGYTLEERDEYIRARAVKQMLWGTALSLGALTLWGFPEQEGLLPHMPAYFAAIFWFAGFGIAGCVGKLLDR